MKISIVMATYNGEKYLIEQLDSLRDQTRSADEVIIRDDGSTDSTPVLIREYIQNNNLSDKWNFEVNKSNKGVILNFLDGARDATGEIIFYSDQDDRWDIHKLELMEDGFKQHPDMVACYCLRHFMDENGKEIPQKLDFMTNVKVRTDSFQKVSLTEAVRYNKSPGLCLAIKKNLIEETRDTILKNGLTHDLPIGTIAAIHDGYYVLNQKLVYYRQHSKNVSAARYNVKSRLSRIDRQIDGRVGRYEQMVAIYNMYGDQLSSRDRKNLNRAIKDTKESIENLEKRKVGKLFCSIFRHSPMMNRWIAVNNFLICLRRNA